MAAKRKTATNRVQMNDEQERILALALGGMRGKSGFVMFDGKLMTPEGFVKRAIKAFGLDWKIEKEARRGR